MMICVSYAVLEEKRLRDFSHQSTNHLPQALFFWKIEANIVYCYYLKDRDCGKTSEAHISIDIEAKGRMLGSQSFVANKWQNSHNEFL
jgi:hypothetical protein